MNRTLYSITIQGPGGHLSGSASNGKTTVFYVNISNEEQLLDDLQNIKADLSSLIQDIEENNKILG